MAAPNETYQDFDFSEFVAALFKREPENPFYFRMEFLEQMSIDNLQQLLGYLVVTGAKTLYEKELAYLAEEEIATLLRYLRSIGWDADFTVGDSTEATLEGTDEKGNIVTKTMPANHFVILFKPCDQSFNQFNQAERLG